MAKLPVKSGDDRESQIYRSLRNRESNVEISGDLGRKPQFVTRIMPVVERFVDIERATVLRDTGCNTVLV